MGGVQVRDPYGFDDGPDEVVDAPPLPAEGHRWRVARWVPSIRAAGVLIFVAGALLGGGHGQTFVCAVAATVLAALLLRDVLAPYRLSVDPGGITALSGFATRNRLEWRDIEAIKEDRRQRFGVTTSSLEIDAGDSIHLFSSAQLGADCAVVARQLRDYAADRHSTSAPTAERPDRASGPTEQQPR